MHQYDWSGHRQPPLTDVIFSVDPAISQVLCMGDAASRLVMAMPPAGEPSARISAAALYADTVPALDNAWEPSDRRRPGWLHRSLGLNPEEQATGARV